MDTDRKHYRQQGTLSNLKNISYRIGAWLRYYTGAQGNILATPPSDYKLVLDSQTPVGGDNNWRTGHPWGRVHADQLWRYWPRETVVWNRDGVLKLGLQRIPRRFKRAEQPRWLQGRLPVEWTPQWATGLVSSKDSYTYGWFEAQIKLPTQKWMWSAFWLMGSDGWPPEIDIFEALTRENAEDISMLPNIHWGDKGSTTFPKGDWGAPRIKLKSPNRRWIQYACHWTPEFIRIYMDGHLVQECTIPRVLEQFSVPQYVILNNGCQNPKVTGGEPSEGTMEVRGVKVYQKN